MQHVRLMTLRTRWTGLARATRRTGFVVLATRTRLSPLTERYWPCLAGASATCTAPPPIRAQPAAQADSFARAIRTDISGALFSCAREGTKLTGAPSHRSSLPSRTQRLVNRTTPLTLIPQSRSEIRVIFSNLETQVCRNETAPHCVCKPSRRRCGAQSPGARSAGASNNPPWLPLGGAKPRWRHPASLRQRPRAVRATMPSWIR